MKKPVHAGAIIFILALLSACSAEQGNAASAGKPTEAFLTVAKEGNLAGVKAALRAGTSIDTRDADHRTALWHAAECGDWEMAELLVNEGADVNAKDSYATPLHRAIEGGHEDIVELLIESGADVNQRCILSCSGYSCTSLHLAAKCSNLDVMRTLLGQSADVNARDRLGESPLHYAARAGDEKIAELLIREGADINALDVNCSTPLDMARNDTLKKMLRSFGAMHAREIMSDTEMGEAAK